MLIRTDNCIFTDTKKQIDAVAGDEFYTIYGDQDFFDENNNPRLSNDNDKTLAKKVFTENKAKYLVKLDTNGKFFDPTNILAKDSGSKNNFLSRTCKQPKFKPVSQETFVLYLNFLKTKNLSWLYNANRGDE